MKKSLFLFAAMLLVSVCGFAQSNTPVRGDVNKDGTVDEQDILAILQIMQNSGGIGGAKTYYWYVGQTDPSTMTEISPTVSDTSSPGWRLIGNTLPTYSVSNKLWDGTNEITTGSSFAKQYILIPNESAACPRDGAGSDASETGIYNKLSNITIDNVVYKVYETVGNKKKHDLDIY